MQQLNVTLSPYSDLPKTQIAYFEGDFDGAAKDSITELHTAVEGLPEGSTLILDFSKLNYLNSFAIGQMVEWHNLIETKAGKVIVVGTNKNVEDIFTVLGIGDIFKSYESLDQAKSDIIKS